MFFSLARYAGYCCSIFFLISFPCFADLASRTLYLTWIHDPQTTMTLQWITPLQQVNSHVDYQAIGDSEWQSQKGSSFPLFPNSQYLVHRVELTELKPNTVYQFKAPPSEEEFRFQTMPTDLNHPIQFVVGGDMYHDNIELMKETSRQAAKTDPDFALIGGDIAYAVGRTSEPQNVEKWIDWIEAWHECMITSEHRLIPVLAAIGNHDVPGHFDQTPEKATIFRALFPASEDQIYHVLDFGSYLSLFILDSGHANPIDGEQTDWLKKNLEERQNIIHRLAIYHVPAYPSFRCWNQKYSALIRQYWVPLFEKYGISLVFENHDHTYKRTRPLLNNKVNKNGITYIGDGAWGVAQPRRPQSVRKPFYLEKLNPIRHFLKIKLHQEKQQVFCLDPQGNLIDYYKKELNTPKSMSLING
jgi:hypothetical protein